MRLGYSFGRLRLRKYFVPGSKFSAPMAPATAPGKIARLRLQILELREILHGCSTDEAGKTPGLRLRLRLKFPGGSGSGQSVSAPAALALYTHSLVICPYMVFYHLACAYAYT